MVIIIPDDSLVTVDEVCRVLQIGTIGLRKRIETWKFPPPRQGHGMNRLWRGSDLNNPEARLRELGKLQ
jgi:hypothetical protein